MVWFSAYRVRLTAHTFNTKMAALFDGLNKLITLDTGTRILGVQTLWSDWVRWHSTSDNGKYLPAFRIIGGDPIDNTAGTSIPFYIYLMNGWRIRPNEADHVLNIKGGVLLVEEGGDPFLDTLGDFTVRIVYSNPLEAINIGPNVATIPTACDIAQAIRTELACELHRINSFVTPMTVQDYLALS
jgi:hypothetical protein